MWNVRWNVCELDKSVSLHGRVTFYLQLNKQSSSEGPLLENYMVSGVVSSPNLWSWGTSTPQSLSCCLSMPHQVSGLCTACLQDGFRVAYAARFLTEVEI